jgi:hypothetical protein
MKAQPASKPQPEKRQAEKRAKKSAPEKARSAAPVVMANDVVPYLEFVEKHPAGTKVKAVVQSYAANGVTVSIGNVAGYVPLRNMATPIPRSARDVFKIGDTVTLTVVGYTPARRSVDLGVPDVVASFVKAPATKPGAKKAPAKKATKTATTKAVAKKAAVKKVAKAAVAKAPAKKAAPKKAVVKKVAAKKTPAKKPAAKKK